MPDTPSILVVDDAKDIRLLLRALLSRAGWRVTEASRGADVDAILARELPDVILLDVQMPDRDVWTTLTSIRNNPASTDVAVVMCSVKGQPADRERGWRLGCDGFITKPFTIDEVINELSAVVARSPTQRMTVRREQLAILTSLETTR